MRMHRFATVGLLAVGLAGAQSVSGQESSEAQGLFTQDMEEAPLGVRIHVENDNFLDIEVYAVRGATRVRLGTVRSQEARFFDLPFRAMEAGQQVQLMADPVGSRQTHTTGSVVISPGDVVQWRLANSLNLSSLAVWSS